MRLRPCLAPLALLLTLLVGTPALGFEPPSVLGSDGTLYTLRAGADRSTLTLEIRRSDGEVVHEVVPTEGQISTLSAPSLFIDGTTDTVTIVGEFRSGSPHSRLNLVSFHKGGWSEIIEVSGQAFSIKGSPKLVVTRDRLSPAPGDGEGHTYQRKILHTIWWEATGAGIETFYTPILILDGEYVGWNPVYRLSDFLPPPGEETWPVTQGLLKSPAILPGRSSSSVTLASADAADGRLWSFEIHVLHGDWSVLAEAGRRLVLDSGAPANQEEAGQLADKARSQIIEIGASLPLHPGKVAFAALALADEIRATGAGASVDSLAERARSQIIEIGASFAPQSESHDGHLVEKARSQIIEIGHDLPVGSEGGGAFVHALTLSAASSWAVPEIGDAAQPTLIVSEKGDRLLVAWDEGSRVRYRETRGAGWSPVYQLQLGEGLSRDAAYEILRQRIRSR